VMSGPSIGTRSKIVRRRLYFKCDQLTSGAAKPLGNSPVATLDAACVPPLKA
jgi:hypothetical protein